jgi:hypothetical protein
MVWLYRSPIQVGRGGGGGYFTRFAVEGLEDGWLAGGGGGEGGQHCEDRLSAGKRMEKLKEEKSVDVVVKHT